MPEHDEINTCKHCGYTIKYSQNTGFWGHTAPDPGYFGNNGFWVICGKPEPGGPTFQVPHQAVEPTFTTRFMTHASRKEQRWIDGPEFPTLDLARLYCALIRLFGPDVQHTRINDPQGKQLYFVDNEWAAIYDLVTWTGLGNPDQVADLMADPIQGIRLKWQK